MAVYTFSSNVSVSAGSGATIWYVSPDGDNSDGTSLIKAWRDWGDVVWGNISAGDFIYVYPGIYYDQLRPTVSGTAGNPITILGIGCTAATPAIFEGGRSTVLLPQNGESGWSAESAIENGIWIDKNYITIDGGDLNGFQVRSWIGYGCRIQNGVSGFIFRNTEGYNNGWVTLGTGWDGQTYGTNIAKTNGHFIRLGSTSIIERCVSHDNGADGIQSLFAPIGINSSTINQCWFYNARKHTIATGRPTSGPNTKSFNWGAHSDAIQFYDGGTIDGVNFQRCHFGPGLTNSIVMGDVSTSTSVINLTITDCTFDRPSDNALFANNGTAGDTWTINRCTVVATNSELHAIYTEGDDWAITNSLVESVASGADIDLNGTGYTFSNNYYRSVTLNSGTSGFGTSQTETIFPLADLSDNFILNNYTPRTTISGAGSQYTTVQEYLGLGNVTISGPNAFGQYTFTAVETGGGGTGGGETGGGETGGGGTGGGETGGGETGGGETGGGGTGGGETGGGETGGGETGGGGTGGGETGGGETGGGGTGGTYEYPLNTAFVRVVRRVSDVISRVRTSMRDTENRRWSDDEMYNAINRSLDTWANRVYIPCVYDMPEDLEWNKIAYTIPYYIREPFILQRRIERWYWTGQNADDRWSDVQGAYAISDGQGGQSVYVDVDTNWLHKEDVRILWHAEVGHVPPFKVYLGATLGADATTMTVSSAISDTIGDVGYVMLDQELIQYSGVSDTPTTTTLHGLLRGCNGTIKTQHSNGIEAEWCIPYVDASLNNVLQTQVRSYLQSYYLTDSSAKETEHFQWVMRWEQQIADDFWNTWLPNRKPQITLSRQAIQNPEY